MAETGLALVAILCPKVLLFRDKTLPAPQKLRMSSLYGESGLTLDPCSGKYVSLPPQALSTFEALPIINMLPRSVQVGLVYY